MLFLLVAGCATVQPRQAHLAARRLTPGADLRLAIENWVKEEDLKAGAIVAAVGSLEFVNLRFANQKEATRIEGPLEIVSLSGTVAKSGVHLHLAVADRRGKTYGGHLVPGSSVFTTAEIVLQRVEGVEFLRRLDPGTGYEELHVESSAD